MYSIAKNLSCQGEGSGPNTPGQIRKNVTEVFID